MEILHSCIDVLQIGIGKLFVLVRITLTEMERILILRKKAIAIININQSIN